VDADPGPAWRGTEVHRVLHQWAALDGARPDALMPRLRAMLAAEHVHPLLRALWQPRLVEAIDWIAREVASDAASGRHILATEAKGKLA
ncbi:hypothetical protein, partial [Enterococcus faecalis]|uniref:hypothetical protein n=1 Tax=Enterococcus faecalis TaxID=1351 RepID=UPI00403F747F